MTTSASAEVRATPGDASALTACTIISKNYVAFARQLAYSFLEAHPEGRMYVLIVDRLEPGQLRHDEPFTVVEIEELDDIPDLTGFLFQYTQLECNTAAKPFFLDYLLRHAGVDRVVYLDPDIQVFRRFDGIHDLLDRHSIVLTPHLTVPCDDGRLPGEREILRAGIFNLGFIALRRSETTRAFLDWWMHRLSDRCISDQPNGLFVDQRWIDLVPGYFDDFFVLREPGYNVAYWNLHERKVARAGEYLVNGSPLYFFHFSGLQLHAMEGVSKYQDRFTLAELGDAAELFHRYRERVIELGHPEFESLPYAFATYDDGVPITDDERRVYREFEGDRRVFGNPFEARSRDSFARWYKRAHRRWAPWVPGARRPPSGSPAVSSEADREAGAAVHAAARGRVPSFLTTPGVNLVGYLTARSGMGEVARRMALSLESAGVPVSRHCIDLNVLGSGREEDPSLEVASSFPYDVNLLCVNADQVPQVVAHLGRGVLCGRRNVGYWLWETADFPARHHDAFGCFDEIWTSSTHCVEALSAVTSVPVRHVPLPVLPPAPRRGDRAGFGIPEDEFVFLFAFDFLSVWQRKNPIAVVRAFRQAFSDEPVRLVLKCSNSEFDEKGLALIEREVGDARVTLIDRTLSREGVDDLFGACDAYVSLHRAEGFGLTVAEAMARGMPVVATEYAGVTDFFGAENGWPVRYELVTLKKDIGPYPAGTRWAEPDVSHAAEQMRRVYDDAADRERRTRRAIEDVREHLGVESVGRVAARLADDLRGRATSPGHARAPEPA